MVNKPFQYIIYGLMIILGIIAMYSIFNAGNPNSILRPIFPDTRYDSVIALGSSFAVFMLGFVVFYTRDSEGFRNLIELNGKKIKALRKKKNSDEEIADSILKAMGSHHGYRHRMARKKLIAHLQEFK